MTSSFSPLLQRTIMRELAQTFLLCVVSLLTLVLISRGLQMRDLFLGLQLQPQDMAWLFIYMTPSFLSLILPISCMLSVFLTFLRMNTDRELIALKAGGISVYQMLSAPAIFSLICMGLALFISLSGIAWGMGNFRSTVMDIASTRAKIVLEPGVFNPSIPGLTLFARKVDPKTGELQGVLFEDKEHTKGTDITILAPRGEILNDEDKGQLIFNLYDGRIYRVGEDQFSILSFKSYSTYVNLNDILSGVDLGDIKPREMSLEALHQTLQGDGESSERLIYRVRMEIQKRWSLPVACLVLGLFAFPLACSFEGVRRQLGIVLSLIFFLLYYALFSLGMNLAETGTLSPAIALWTPNALFAAAAMVGLHLIARERGFSIPSLLRHSRFSKRPGRSGGASGGAS